MNYKKTYIPQKGYTPLCKIGQCSLKKLEFGIIELDAGEKLPFDTCDKETAFIMLAGHCDVRVNGQVWENIGNRNNVFENRKAESFYAGRDTQLEITARDHIKIAVCATPVSEKTELVEFPRGYHATVTTPGYQSYLLWLMAGDYQGFNRSSDPDHVWMENL